MIAGAPAAGKGTQCEQIVKKVWKSSAFDSCLDIFSHLVMPLACARICAAGRDQQQTSDADRPRGSLYLRKFSKSAAECLFLLLCDVQYDLVHISVGDLLREQVAQGTPAGKCCGGEGWTRGGVHETACTRSR
jgi:hypothetical protein